MARTVTAGLILTLVAGSGWGCGSRISRSRREARPSAAAMDLSPTTWKADYERFLAAQAVDRSSAGMAEGDHGAVTVAYNGLAARAGLEAMKQGGNAMDAALTAALTQVAAAAGSSVSYFGILSLVYYDAASGEVSTLNAEWNTVLGEDDPLSIPGQLDLSSELGVSGEAVSGRTALVGGFMKGVGAAHSRFGRLPFEEIFAPAIYLAEHGMPVTLRLAEKLRMRGADLRRLPETRAVFVGGDGDLPQVGEIFRQPALAATLRAVAREGVDYLYRGPWAEKLVAALAADGGKMSLKDLAAYEVLWDRPLVADLGGYQVHTSPPPNMGGVQLVEAQRLAEASRLIADGHWSRSGKALRKALDITALALLDELPEEVRLAAFPQIDFAPQARLSSDHAARLWHRASAGRPPLPYKPAPPRHSDDVVAVDAQGNIAALTHSINCIDWGKTAIFVDGVSIGDPASFQQAKIAQLKPGSRLPAPTEQGILFADGKPRLAFASMGSGLHQRTFTALLNVMSFGMRVDEAINSADFFFPTVDAATGELTVGVPKGRFPASVLEEMGYAYREFDPDKARLGGEGLWVAIEIDPQSGRRRAASHNRNNSAALAY